MRPNCVAVIAFSVLLLGAACHKRVPVSPLPARPAPTPTVSTPDLAPAPEPTPPPTPPPAPAAPSPAALALDQANRAFASASYDEAVRGFENYLRLTPSGGEEREQALFHLGLAYALRPAPATDWMRATATLKQLIDEYPNSLLKPPASVILSLHAEVDQASTDAKQRDQRIKQLTTELDRLKKIDADRRKQRP